MKRAQQFCKALYLFLVAYFLWLIVSSLTLAPIWMDLCSAVLLAVITPWVVD